MKERHWSRECKWGIQNFADLSVELVSNLPVSVLFLAAMIPRTARRLETTLLSSRQSLPRPARLYSSPSKKLNAPATATAHLPRTDFPAFFPPPQNIVHDQDSAASSSSHLLEDFLGRKIPYTIIPTPLPSDVPLNDRERWFTDSATQDQAAVMDACLHNLYDVPRAKLIFDRLRTKKGSAILHVSMYNLVMESYLAMAEKDAQQTAYWVEEIWKLYTDMENGNEQMSPTAGTFALMLQAWHKFVTALSTCTQCLTERN